MEFDDLGGSHRFKRHGAMLTVPLFFMASPQSAKKCCGLTLTDHDEEILLHLKRKHVGDPKFKYKKMAAEALRVYHKDWDSAKIKGVLRPDSQVKWAQVEASTFAF